MSSPQINKSRRVLLLTLAVFVLPVVLAKLALELEWFDYGVTNQGELSTQHLTLADLGLPSTDFDEQWLLLYRVPETCAEACLNSLSAINSAFVLLGKEVPRVTPVTLAEQPLSELQQQAMRHGKWQSHYLPQQNDNHIKPSQLLVIDPLGNVVMSYQAPQEKSAIAQFAKSILSDMKKLLKFSRIG